MVDGAGMSGLTVGAVIAPAWFVLPVSILALMVVAGHWVSLGKADMPPFRKGLRSANGLLMMITIPVLAYAFGIADSADQRRFVLSWMLATALLVLVLVVALLDAGHTMVLASRERARLREEYRKARIAKAAERAADEPTPERL
ncbi:MAG TPA: hypothetical protein VD971_07455 [Phycisphaerales bacterium]|nr:hypothetical protein [Phycisphaerales bacterium]